MKLIVQTSYDMLMLKNLIELCVFPKMPGAVTHEFEDENGVRTIKFLTGGMCIECQLIPEYKTEYRIIENNRADDLIDDIQELIREYKER